MANLIEALKNLVDSVMVSFTELREEFVNDEQRHRCSRLCNETIEYFNTILLDPQTTVQVKRSIQAHITQLNWIAEQYSFLGDQVIGGDLQINNQRIRWQDMENAFAGNIKTGCIINQTHTDLRSFLHDFQNVVINKVQDMLHNHMSLKVNVELFCMFRNSKAEQTVKETKSFITRSREILRGAPLQDWYVQHVYNKLLQKVEEFNQKDSGWSLHEINNLMVTMSRYTPTQAGNSTYVTLPKDIQSRHAVLNIQNKDEFCFLWCVNAALHPPVYHPERTSEYQHFSTRLRYDGIRFPIKLNDIPKFEILNDLSINVYGIESEFNNKKSEKSVIIPLYLSEYKTDKDVIHLLMISKNVDYSDNFENINSVFHFALIRDLSRLIKSQLTLSRCKLYFCDRCLNHFKLEKSYIEHKSDCFKSNKVRMELPSEKNRILKFKDYKFKDTVPFVIYADQECTLESQGDDEKKVHKHVLNSIAFYVHCSYDEKLSKFELNRSTDCIDWFIKQLELLAIDFEKILSNPVKMKPLTKEQQERHDQATVCHICEKPITSTKDKCYDHCHFTGLYRNAAHISCNVNYQKTTIIPVVFHNLSGYDSHFLIKALATVIEGEITLLPINKERYISFTKSIQNTSVSLRFIDSFRFMASSLEKLASNLDDTDKRITRHHYSDPDKFLLVTRKGVFPYEYIDSIDRLDEKQLPGQDSFYSTLTNSSISDEDYAFAQVVWNELKINTLGEYSDLYLKTDVLLLADVFENFRQSCFKTYNLDALHFYMAPGLSHSAMLKYTSVELELLTDPEMLLFIEKGIRGGVSMCANRHAKANNHYMIRDFDETEPEGSIGM